MGLQQQLIVLVVPLPLGFHLSPLGPSPFHPQDLSSLFATCDRRLRPITAISSSPSPLLGFTTVVGVHDCCEVEHPSLESDINARYVFCFFSHFCELLQACFFFQQMFLYHWVFASFFFNKLVQFQNNKTSLIILYCFVIWYQLLKLLF